MALVATLGVSVGPAWADVPLSPGAVTTTAGNGTSATVDGMGTAASLKPTSGLVFASGSLFVATTDSIRRVDTATTAVSTLAGGGSGAACRNSAVAASVTFGSASSMVSDGASLFTVISCSSNSWTVRSTSIASGATSSIGSFSATGGATASSAALVGGFVFVAVGQSVYRVNLSTGVSSVFASESAGWTLRSLASDGSFLWTVAYESASGKSRLDSVDLSTGSVAPVGLPLSFDAGGPGGTSIANAGSYLFVAWGNTIRRYAKADASFVDVAGTGQYGTGFADGTGADAWFRSIDAMVYDGAGLWVSDQTRVRRVVDGTALPSAQSPTATTSVSIPAAEMRTITGQGVSANVNGLAPRASFEGGNGLVTIGTTAYVATSSALQVFDLATGVESTLVPAGPSNNCGANSDSGALASLRYATSMTTDGHFLFVGDQCGAVRRVSVATGATSTVLSVGSTSRPGALSMGPDGFLYMAGIVTNGGAQFDPTVYRINPRTGLKSVFASEAGATRLWAMTSDDTALWLVVKMPCTGTPCGQENKLDRIDLATGAITTLVADPRPNPTVNSQAPYGTALVSAGGFLYAEAGSTLRVYDKATGVHGDIAGFYNPNQGIIPPVDGYTDQARINSVAAMASNGSSLFFIDRPGYLRMAIPAPVSPIIGVTEAEANAGGGNRDTCDCANQAQRSDPVNTAFGELWESATDVALPGRFAVPWTRTYSSTKAAQDSPLGFGWSGEFVEKITPGATGADPVKVTTETGAITTFTPTSTVAAFSASPRVHASLRRDPAAGTWTYVRRKGVTMVFRNDGRLVSKTDRNGETITLTYTTTTPVQLASVTTPDGRALSLTYNAAGRIWKVTGPSITGVPARVTTYLYDAAGNLTTVTDSRGKTWTYGYDANHRLTSLTRPGGGVTTTHYDATGKVDWQRDPRLKTTTFAYTDTTVGTDLHRTTRATDPTGVVTDYVYVNGWMTSQTVAPGTAGASTTYFTHDLSGNQTSVTDPTGVVTSATFDGDGNRLTQVVPSGATMADGSVPGKLTTTWKYNQFNEPLLQSDTNGGSTSWTYDAWGNVLTQAQVLNNTDTATTVWSRTDAAHHGDAFSATDPMGRATTFAYTAAGFVASVTKPAGNVTDTTDTTVRSSATYTPYGEVLTSVEPRGNITGGTPASYTTTNTYDGGGLLLTTTTPLALTTTFTYDGDGHRLTVQNNAGKIWATAYLPDASIDTLTDPLLHVTTTNAYDDAGRLISVTDATGRITATTYDDHGWVATTIRPTGNAAGASAAVKAANTTTVHYDLAGRVTTTATPDPTGGADLVNVTTYDGAGRVWKSTDPAFQTTTTTYDGANRVTAVKDPAGGTTSFIYDYAGRRTYVTDARAHYTATTYNKDNEVTRIVDPMTTSTSPNGRTTVQTWDTAGHLATVVEPRGNANGAVAANYTTTYTYDPAGNLRTLTDPLAHPTTTTYDADGRVATHVTGKNRTTTNTYDTTGRLWKITAPDTGVTVYGYDAGDRRTTVTAPMLGVWGSGYDDAGRLTSETDPGSVTRAYGYTTDGDLAIVTSPRGTATRGYNALGQLTSLTFTDTTRAVSYTYDRAGRRASMTDAAGTVAYTYDPASRPTAITRTPTSGPVTAWGYGYDANGNVKTRTRPDTSTETWTYDNANQATLVTNPTGTTTFGYDDAGNLTTTTMPNGTTETKAWDRDGALASITTKAGATVLTSQTVTRDAVDQPTKTVVVRGTATENRSYLYDTNERLTDVCYAATCTADTATQHWTYDKNGNRLTEQNGITPGVVTTSTYDTSDRVATSKVGTGAAVSPTYDADGNLTNDATGHTATFRLDGLTATATSGGATTSYGYDGDGTRLTATTTGTGATSTYTWDPNQELSSLAQVVTDPDGTGPTAATTTVNRFDPLGMLLSVTASGATSFVSHDPLGSVTDLTSNMGAIARSADYTPYGAPRTPIGAPASPSGPSSVLGFTGALTDPTGQLYLHARQYDPTTGQFTARDPAGKGGSAGYHGWYGSPYGYVTGRVVLTIDPTGRFEVFPGQDAITQLWLGEWDAVSSMAIGLATSQGRQAAAQSIANQCAEDGWTSTNSQQHNCLSDILGERNVEDNARAASSAFHCDDVRGFAKAGTPIALAVASLAAPELRLGGAAMRGGVRAAAEAAPVASDGATPWFRSVGSRGRPLVVPRGNNTETMIGGRLYGGHSLDEMQSEGFVPSVVEDVIENGAPSLQSSGRMAYHSPSNNVTVITENGKVVTVTSGTVKPR